MKQLNSKQMRLKQSIRTTKKTIDALESKKGLSVKEKKTLERSRKRLEERYVLLNQVETNPLKRVEKQEKSEASFHDYSEYLSSPEWEARRLKYYETHKKECRSCGTWERSIHLHHKSYHRIYMEDDSDLVPLCSECHANLHLVQKTLSISVEEATDLWFSGTIRKANKSNRKKVQAMLRKTSHKEFRVAWEARQKTGSDKREMLLDTMRRLRSKPAAPKVISEKKINNIKKMFSIARYTGDEKKYDAMVDGLVKKLGRM